MNNMQRQGNSEKVKKNINFKNQFQEQLKTSKNATVGHSDICWNQF